MRLLYIKKTVSSIKPQNSEYLRVFESFHFVFVCILFYSSLRKIDRAVMITLAAFLSSSMAEHSAVNRRVVSSSLTWGAKEKRPSFDGRFSFSCTAAYNPRLTAAAENLCGAERPQCGIQRGGSAGETGRKAHSARFSTMFHHGTGCKFESYLGSHEKSVFCLPTKGAFFNDIRSCRNG